MKTAKKTILIYGLAAGQKLTLAMLAQKAGIRLKVLSDRETMLPIGALLSDRELPEMPALPVPGKFALLDGFAGSEHEAAAMINQAAPGVIKAAHTQTNDSWRFCDLCSAILLEHKTMSGLE